MFLFQDALLAPSLVANSLYTSANEVLSGFLGASHTFQSHLLKCSGIVCQWILHRQKCLQCLILRTCLEVHYTLSVSFGYFSFGLFLFHNLLPSEKCLLQRAVMSYECWLTWIQKWFHKILGLILIIRVPGEFSRSSEGGGLNLSSLVIVPTPALYTPSTPSYYYLVLIIHMSTSFLFFLPHLTDSFCPPFQVISMQTSLWILPSHFYCPSFITLFLKILVYSNLHYRYYIFICSPY